MMASSARHLFLLAFIVAVLAVATPRADAWGGGRFFFSKTTRPQAAVDEPAEKAAAVGDTAAVPAADAADPNGATAALSRPSTGGNGGRGYGLYGRPEESFPPDYFRRGVHRNAEKLTTTTTSAADQEPVPAGGRGGERAEALPEDDNGSGRGRPPWTSAEETTVPVGGSRGGERAEPFVEDNGSGRGRPPWTNANDVATTTRTEGIRGGGERAEPFVEGSGRGRTRWRYGPDAEGGPEEEEQSRRNYYGMSDTRLYQNGRYYYDVDAGRYGYGRESNPVRTRPEEFAGDRRGRYNGNAAAGYHFYGNGNEFGNGVMENQNGFQEEGQTGRYIP